MDKLLTYKEVGEMLHISVRQVKYYIKTKRIPFIQLSERKRYIKEDDLSKYLNNNTFRVK